MKKGDDPATLERIIDYCNKIHDRILFFGNDEDDFLDNAAFQDACAFNILQIGEFVGSLSDGLRNKYTEVEWKNIIGFRNIIAHDYGKVMPSLLWNTVTKNVPELKDTCERILNDLRSG